MTAFFGYVSPHRGVGFLGADNLEAYSRSTVDKIELIEGRFGVGVAGQDVAYHVLGKLRSYEKVTYRDRYETCERVAQSVLDHLRLHMGYLYPMYSEAHGRGEIEDRQWTALEREGVLLVILDSKELKLCVSDLGSAFPPSALKSKADVEYLRHEALYGFALAGSGANYKEWPACADAMESPAELLRGLLGTEPLTGLSAVGDLGSLFSVDREGLIYQSAFSSSEKLFASRGRPPVGWNVTVICGRQEAGSE